MVESIPDESKESALSLFKYQTNVTRPGETIKAYYSDIFERYKEESGALLCTYGVKDDDSLRFAVYLMHRLAKDFAYESGVTDIRTTAEEALRCKTGVCQDYAHIMISLCRMKRIPCRYVTVATTRVADSRTLHCSTSCRPQA